MKKTILPIIILYYILCSLSCSDPTTNTEKKANTPTSKTTQPQATAIIAQPTVQTPVTPKKADLAWWKGLDSQWQQLLDKKLSEKRLVTEADIQKLHDQTVTFVAPSIMPGDLTALEHLSNLHHISVAGNGLTSLQSIAYLPKIRILEAANNQIPDLEPLRDKKELQFIRLPFNHIKDLTPLATLTRLRELDIRQNRIKDISPLRQCTQLFLLNISQTMVEDLSPLSSASLMRELRLSGTNVADLTPIKALNGMKVLNISDTPISSIAPIMHFSSLKELNCRKTKVPEEELKVFMEKNPKCKVLL